MKKFIVWFFLFILFGPLSVYALELKPTPQPDCPAPMSVEECNRKREAEKNNPYKNIKEVIISNWNYKISEWQKLYTPTGQDFISWYNNDYSSVVYTFTNSNTELIYFLNDGTYCNSFLWICKKFVNSSSDSSYRIFQNYNYYPYMQTFKTEKYIFFLTSNPWGNISNYSNVMPYLLVYDIKSNKWFSIDLGYYLQHNKYKSNWQDVDLSYLFSILDYNNISFDVYNWILNIYIYYQHYQNDNWVKEKWKIMNIQIDTNNINSELFSFDNKLFTKICLNSKWQNNQFEKYIEKTYKFLYLPWWLNRYFNDSSTWTSECNFFVRDLKKSRFDFSSYDNLSFNEKLKNWTWIKYWFLDDSDSNIDFRDTYIEKRAKMKQYWVAYITDSTAFYNNARTWSFVTSYFTKNKDWLLTFNNDEFWSWFGNIFTNYTNLSISRDKDTKLFYISYRVNDKLNTIKTKQLYDLNNSDYELLENKYYLWKYNGIEVYYTWGVESVKNKLANLYYPSLFVARSWDNLKFFYIRQYSWYSFSLYTFSDTVFQNFAWPFWGFNFWKNLVIWNSSFNDWWWQKDEDWNYLNNEELQKLKKDKEAPKNNFNKFFSDMPIIWNLVNTFSLWFPKDWNKALNVPFLKPQIENWKAKVWYEVYNVNLQPVNDKLKINALWEGSELSKKVISFFLALFYIFVKVWLFFLWFLILRFLFNVILGIKNAFFPFLRISNTTGNVWVLWIFLAYCFAYFTLAVTLLGSVSFLSEFVLSLKNIIDLIFWFIVSNFFNLSVFSDIVWVFDVWVLWLALWYVWMQVAVGFWKIN